MNKNTIQDTSDIADIELLHRLRKGDAMAFTIIYNKHFNMVFSYCYQFTKNQHETEDIVQEVFVRLWKNRGQLKKHNNINNLIFFIAKNLLIDAYRKNINSPIYENYVEYYNSIKSDESDILEYNEFHNRVLRIIDSLPPAQSLILKMSRFDNKSNREIANELGIQEQVVKNQLSRAMKILREKLDLFISFLLVLFIH